MKSISGINLDFVQTCCKRRNLLRNEDVVTQICCFEVTRIGCDISIAQYYIHKNLPFARGRYYNVKCSIYNTERSPNFSCVMASAMNNINKNLEGYKPCNLEHP